MHNAPKSITADASQANDDQAPSEPAQAAAQAPAANPQGVDPSDDGVIISDSPEPWLPVMLNLTLGVPTAVVSIGIGVLVAWSSANTGIGTILSLTAGILGAVLVLLAVIDAKTLRLPDPIVFTSYGVISALVISACLTGELSFVDTLITFGCMAGIWGLWWVLAVVTGGIAYGDVKVGGLIGLGLGTSGVGAASLGAVLAPILLAGFVSIALIAAGKRKLAIPFGPFLAGGALLVMLVPTLPSSVYGY